MANCSSDFVITKGSDNNFTFTIKQDGSTLPMELTNSDTFTAKLVTLDGQTTAISKSMTLDTNLLSGKVHLTITSSEANSLISSRGTEVDRYYLRPTYKLVIEASTANNGDFLAKVNEVYVD